MGHSSSLNLGVLEREGPLIEPRVPWFDCRATCSSTCAEAFDAFPTQIIQDVGDQTQLILARRRLFSSHLQLKYNSFYRNEQQIGEGSYGSVYEAVVLPFVRPSEMPAIGESGQQATPLEADTGGTTPEASQPSAPNARRVAVKAFSLDSNGKEIMSNREAASKHASFERERSILARIEHPHIVRIFECFEERGMLAIVMELCRGGELYVQIVNKSRERLGGGGFEEAPSRRFFRQMLFGSSYLHARRIVHRDIKTENFLLLGDTANPEEDTIKLCDFGTAVQLTDQMPRAMERIGTLSYTAPEIYQKAGCDMLADAWSLGVVLYVLLVGASPFRQGTQEAREATIRRICAGEYDKTRPAWTQLSRQSVDIVSKLIVVNETQRMSSVDALGHRWLQEHTSRRAKLDGFAKYGRHLVQLLLRFAKLHAMQQLALLVCAQRMGEAELLDIMRSFPLYEIFVALDHDQDGALSFKEFAAGLDIMCGSVYSMDILVALLQSIDMDGSGAIEWIEWVAVSLLSVAFKDLWPEPLVSAFRLLDRPSGDDRLGVADLLAVINSDASMTRSLRSDRVREWAIMLIEPWNGQATRGTSRMHPSVPPSLTLEDFQRLMEHALSRPDSENLDVAVTAHARAFATLQVNPVNLRWPLSPRSSRARHYARATREHSHDEVIANVEAFGKPNGEPIHLTEQFPLLVGAADAVEQATADEPAEPPAEPPDPAKSERDPSDCLAEPPSEGKPSRIN